MIFDALYESSKRGELLLIENGFCHWHLRRDGQLTIREIISTKAGAGGRMLEILIDTPHATCIVAKCPCHLPSNEWYKRRGFKFIGQQPTRNAKHAVNIWRLEL